MGSDATNYPSPTWSHGGSTSLSWPKILGNTNGAGNPISLITHGSLGINWPVLILYPRTSDGGVIGTVSMDVFVEANPGPLINGVPDVNAWADQTNNTPYSLTSLVQTILINPALPYWRTRIANWASGFLDSRVGPIQLSDGTFVTAGNPLVKGGGPPPFSSGF